MRMHRNKALVWSYLISIHAGQVENSESLSQQFNIPSTDMNVILYELAKEELIIPSVEGGYRRNVKSQF